jgi:hypothetical protein
MFKLSPCIIKQFTGELLLICRVAVVMACVLSRVEEFPHKKHPKVCDCWKSHHRGIFLALCKVSSTL